jgi:hypothetical protein
MMTLLLQRGGSEKAIPTGALGVFATCDAAKDKRAADELIHLLEEVRRASAHSLCLKRHRGVCSWLLVFHLPSA